MAASRARAGLVAIAVLAWAGAAQADVAPPSPTPTPTLAGLAPPTSDDARSATAIGPNGQVYEADGKGAWVRKTRFTTGNAISTVGRAGDALMAFGEGVVYRLAPNGWSAIRLHQKERAVMSAGPRAVAAVGRQLFALDKTINGEPAKLATVPSAALAIGSGAGASAGVIVQTDRGLFRITGASAVAVKNAPPKIARVVSDRWVLVADGAIDLKTGRKSGWPASVAIAAASTNADGQLVMVAQERGQLELVTITKDGKLERVSITPIDAVGDRTIVGLALDKSGRAVIAMRDGRILVRDSGAWTTTRVTEDLPKPKSGPPPATSR